MKASHYNFFFPHHTVEGKHVAYNARSNSLAFIGNEQLRKLNDCDESEIVIDDEQLVNDLRAGLFLVDDDVDELEMIRFAMYRDRFVTNTLSLTIAPTSDCNFRCIYCYEKDVIDPTYMTVECEDAIVQLVESLMSTISQFSVVWYGGEPLMAIGTIERLTSRFVEACEANEVNYSAIMITNGYLLTKQNVAKLKELKISSMQITIDGMHEAHDKRRPLKGGKPTFDRIMSNIKDNFEELPFISLRINIDNENARHARELATYLDRNGLSSKVRAYLGKVCNDNGCYSDETLFTSKGFASESFDYETSVNTLNISSLYPSQVTAVCGADRYNCFVIGADGSFYKCWSDIGYQDRSIGNILRADIKPNSLYLDYLLFDPTLDEECSQCKLLPVCMGGCPYKRVHKSEKCPIFKYKLNDFLQFIASNTERLGICLESAEAK